MWSERIVQVSRTGNWDLWREEVAHAPRRLDVMELAVSSTVTACGEDVRRESPYVSPAASVKQEANTTAAVAAG